MAAVHAPDVLERATRIPLHRRHGGRGAGTAGLVLLTRGTVLLKSLPKALMEGYGWFRSVAPQGSLTR